jgi:hypothetical protein
MTPDDLERAARERHRRATINVWLVVGGIAAVIVGALAVVRIAFLLGSVAILTGVIRSFRPAPGPGTASAARVSPPRPDGAVINLATLNPMASFALLPIVVSLLALPWDDKQARVRQHQDRLSDPMTLTIALLYLADQAKTTPAVARLLPLIQFHGKLLQRCIEVGIDAAFADAQLRQECEALTQAQPADD